MSTSTVKFSGFRRSLRLIFMVILFPGLLLRAAEEPSQFYDLPAGDAAVTLRQFAEISGQEMLFAADTVRGVRTNAVRGQFTARAALDRMLEETNLQGHHDERSRTWAVRPKPDVAAQKSPATRLVAASSATHSSIRAAGPEQRTSAGSLSGSVSNAATHNLLEGATVAFPQLGLKTLTDVNGRFAVQGIPSGSHELVVSYLGLTTAKTTITIEPGTRATRDFDLTSEI